MKKNTYFWRNNKKESVNIESMSINCLKIILRKIIKQSKTTIVLYDEKHKVYIANGRKKKRI